MLRELLRRRVPQIIGGYLVVIWGVIQFVTFLEGRYALPPHLVEAVGGGMLLLIPSIALLAYGHGRPGPDQWTRSERVVVPLNVVAALVGAVFFLRGDTALGKVTETIQVENEDGVVEERLVPRQEFMHRVTTFFCDNQSGDPGLDYIGTLVPSLLSLVMLQDLSITAASPYAYVEQYREAGFPDGRNTPAALRRDIAQRVRSPYYLTGVYAVADGVITLQTELHAGDGSTLATREFVGAEVMALVDQLAAALREDLGRPESYRDRVPLLPLADILTDNPDALRPFAEGTDAFAIHNDYPTAIAKLNEAVALDPSFCVAHFQLFVVHLLNGDAEELETALDASMKHAYRVPEAQQFSIKMNYFYQIKQDGEKAISVGRMWVKLYPDDPDAHGALLQLLALANEYEEAIASVEKLHQLDPTRDDLLVAAGDLYSEMENYDAALARYQEFADRNPEDARAFVRLAGHMETYGKLSEALEPLETAQLLDPTSIAVVLNRRRVHERLGQLEKAEADLEEAMGLASTDVQRSQVYDAQKIAHVRRGRMKDAIEARARAREEMRKTRSPIQVAVTGMLDYQVFLEAGLPEQAHAEQSALAQVLQGTLAPYASIGAGLLAAETGDIETAETHLGPVRTLVEDQKLENARTPMQQTLAMIHEHRGDYPAAIAALKVALGTSPRSIAVMRELARLSRLHGDLDAAADYLERALVLDPSHPRLHLQAALLAQSRGDIPTAVEHVDRALATWSGADANYRRAHEARALKDELTRSL